MAESKVSSLSKNIKIKLTKSLSGKNNKHIATAHSMGLYKIGQEVIHSDSATLRGKIFQISYLVETNEI